MKYAILFLALLFTNVSFGEYQIQKVEYTQPSPNKAKKKKYKKLKKHQKQNIRRSGGDLTKYKCQ